MNKSIALKNKICIITIILILLAGCTNHSQSSEPIASAPESAPSLPQQPSSGEGAAEKSKDEIFRQQVSEAIGKLKIQDFASAAVLSRLDNMGIEVNVEQIKELDEKHISFELVISQTNGNVLRIPLTATCFYGRFDPEYFDGQIIGNFRVEWGGLSVVDNMTIAISTLQDIQFYNAHTLDNTGLKLTLSSFAGKEYYLLGAKRDNLLGIVAPVFFDDKDGFAFFNEDGSLRETQTFQYGSPGERWFCSNINAESFGGHTLRFEDTFDILNLDAPYLVFGDCYYNVETRSIFGQASTELIAEDGKRRVVLNNFDNWFGHFPAVNGEKSRLALFYENDELRSGFFFNGDEISRSFGRPNVDNYPGLSYKWEIEKPVCSASCPFSDLTITLDFEKQAASLDYNINPEHVEEAFAFSSDGRYSLHRASSDGGGDIGFSNIILKDSQSGALRFIALSGGMYGGYGSIGFFSNGEIYVMTLESLKIISTDPNAPVPVRPFNLPLGLINDNQTRRGLFTFRRDPSTFEYIVLVAGEPVDYSWDTGDVPYKANYNYFVGFCDKDGNMYESFDTGAPVLADQFGLYNMSFKLSGDQLTIIGMGGKGAVGMHGIFDLKTHTYTEITE